MTDRLRLVCCVGAAPQDAKTMIETNFLSVVVLTREVVKGMMARNRGHIVSAAATALTAAAATAALIAAAGTQPPHLRGCCAAPGGHLVLFLHPKPI